MTDVCQFGVISHQIATDTLPSPEHPAFLGVHQATQNPQQTRLPRPVRAGDLQTFTPAHFEAHTLQDVPISSPQVQVLSSKHAPSFSGLVTWRASLANSVA